MVDSSITVKLLTARSFRLDIY